jgi:hypothetical protein
VVDPAALERTHPLYATLPEQAERWTKTLEDLKRGEAFVRTDQTTVKIRTQILPPVRTPESTLGRITERYASRLLVPATTIVPAVDRDLHAVTQRPSLPRRTRMR